MKCKFISGSRIQLELLIKKIKREPRRENKTDSLQVEIAKWYVSVVNIKSSILKLQLINLYPINIKHLINCYNFSELADVVGKYNFQFVFN